METINIDSSQVLSLRKLSYSFQLSGFEMPGSTETENLFLACPPKSASTYMINLCRRLQNFKAVNLLPFRFIEGMDQNPDFLACLFLAIQHPNVRFVARHHTFHTMPVYNLLKAANYKVVVIVRDIFDSLVSVDDHLSRHVQNEGVIPDEIMKSRIPFLAGVCIPADYRDRSFDERMDILIDLMVP